MSLGGADFGYEFTMYKLAQAVLDSDEKIVLKEFIDTLYAADKRYLLRNEILQAFAEYCHQLQKPAYFYHSSSVGKLIHYTHEILLEAESIWFVIRDKIASQEFWRYIPDLSIFEQVTPQALLEARDRQVNREQPQILEINFHPFYQNTPTISDARNIGQGLAFLNHYLCDQLLTKPDYWLAALFAVLQRHEYDGTSLLISDRIVSGLQLRQQVQRALQCVNQYPPDEPYATFHKDLQNLGFDPGWGDTAARVHETLELLNRLITTPEPAVLEAFVSRIPGFFRIVLVSIHGWVGQDEVIGRPETMGQVIYVLDQARNLENQLEQEIKQAGLEWLGIQPQVIILTRLIPNCEGTLCAQRLEKIEGTKNAWILRVPFRDFNPKVTQNWISKFEIWPYLESFAIDAEQALLSQLKGRPSLFIGHYSDGNLVAFLLACRFNAIQCTVAHTLEKSKYLFSDLYWQDFEEHYHFSVQFTADLISMNAADFIITSSYQEIMGTPDAIGQYESYQCFTMPQLYHVVSGVDLFGPKFNRVSPGVNETIFFPYPQTADRDTNMRTRVRALLFSRDDPNIIGNLDHPDNRPILAVGSISLANNLTGLVEWFGQSPALRERCNLILVTNTLHVADASNQEEAGEIEKLHALIDHYQLQGQLRWIGMRLPGHDLGEVYRAIADGRGIFTHFARFEAFGRTILEAMVSGLPTFATQFGGSSEIIQDGINGFHINPTDFDGTTQKIIDFIHQCEINPQSWLDISERAIQHVQTQYNWQLHVKQVLLLAKIYGFWNYVSRDSREALRCYLNALFHLLYKPRAEQILEQHRQR
jgi:sucrose synthase